MIADHLDTADARTGLAVTTKFDGDVDVARTTSPPGRRAAMRNTTERGFARYRVDVTAGAVVGPLMSCGGSRAVELHVGLAEELAQDPLVGQSPG